jgi:hypothetical protein
MEGTLLLVLVDHLEWLGMDMKTHGTFGPVMLLFTEVTGIEYPF